MVIKSFSLPRSLCWIRESFGSLRWIITSVPSLQEGLRRRILKKSVTHLMVFCVLLLSHLRPKLLNARRQI